MSKLFPDIRARVEAATNEGGYEIRAYMQAEMYELVKALVVIKTSDETNDQYAYEVATEALDAYRAWKDGHDK